MEDRVGADDGKRRRIIDPTTSSVGDRLRAAREEDEAVARRHCRPDTHSASPSSKIWKPATGRSFPAPTYTIGFAKSYASAVGLDRTEIGDDLRAEMGGQRFDTASPEVFEPADPARTMPRWLVLSAIGGSSLVVVVMTWLNNRSLAGRKSAGLPVATSEPAQQAAQPPAASPQATAGAGGIRSGRADRDGARLDPGHRRGKTLFSGELAAVGQTYNVPQTAAAPLLKCRQTGSAQDQRRISHCAASRPARQGRVECQPAARRPDAR